MISLRGCTSKSWQAAFQMEICLGVTSVLIQILVILRRIFRFVLRDITGVPPKSYQCKQFYQLLSAFVVNIEELREKDLSVAELKILYKAMLARQLRDWKAGKV